MSIHTYIYVHRDGHHSNVSAMGNRILRMCMHALLYGATQLMAKLKKMIQGHAWYEKLKNKGYAEACRWEEKLKPSNENNNLNNCYGGENWNVMLFWNKNQNNHQLHVEQSINI